MVAISIGCIGISSARAGSEWTTNRTAATICDAVLQPSQATSTSAAARASALWRGGIYDADLRVYMLPNTPSANEPEAVVHAGLSKKAEAYSHLGYATVSCPNHDGKKLGVTTPAKEGPLVVPGRRICVTEAVAQSCRGIVFDFAALAGGKSTRLSSDVCAEIPKSNSGVISATCLRHHPAWLGPQVLYYFPVGSYDQALETSQATSLLVWVNQLRAKHGLKKLEQLAPALRSRISGGDHAGIQHDRDKIANMRDVLRSAGHRFLGENIVESGRWQDAAWLLYMSPRHRDLLLNSEATHIAQSVPKIKGKNRSTTLTVTVFEGLQAVNEQHRDRHGANSSRNRRNRAGNL